MTGLTEFNQMSPDQAAEVIRPCVDVERWVAEVVSRRPYADVEELVATARGAADPFTDAEVEGALAHHPRIGERAQGESAEASLSRAEQAQLSVGADVQRQLEQGNRDYENRFGRVFLIRAAGRSSEEILDQLQSRLGNDVATENSVVADQLRQIALVRLGQAVAA
ncbi:MAG: 2-oxo-4-hydroxy-4-carboxy-5-ureidoimidazoline decarboxylase [Propionibacteriaceae bacterium]